MFHRCLIFNAHAIIFNDRFMPTRDPPPPPSCVQLCRLFALVRGCWWARIHGTQIIINCIQHHLTVNKLVKIKKTSDAYYKQKRTGGKQSCSKISQLNCLSLQKSFGKKKIFFLMKLNLNQQTFCDKHFYKLRIPPLCFFVYEILKLSKNKTSMT